ncbi:NUDIX hydrolase [Christensenellaceae bacterium OttesenSCG-928-K19]|nr:NUDIX hydrolase [Christensenellaceae bacterium OttesenSCG-928-K19]
MDLTEKLLESKEVFDGKLLHVYRDEVSLPNGASSTREIVRHPGGACVCAIDSDLNVAFVRQFRYAYGMEVLELPAGKLERGEEPYFAAARELREEAGLISDDMIPLGELFPSPGYTDEIIHMFLAFNPEPCGQSLDMDEFVKVEKIFLVDAVNMVLNGEIRDAKTQTCLLKAYMLMEYLSAQEEDEEDKEEGK